VQVKLKVILPNGFSYDWSYQGTMLSVGRDPACDLAVDDSESRIVSWMHARIEFDGDTVLVRDFRSKNGTYVNEEAVDGTQPIQIGDTIQLGRKGPRLMVLELDTHQDDIPPAAPPVAAISTAHVGMFGRVKEWMFHDERWIVGGAVAGAIVVLLLLVSMVWLRGREFVRNSPPGQEKKGSSGGSVPCAVKGCNAGKYRCLFSDSSQELRGLKRGDGE
jgi:hypothetical protein